MAWLAAVAAAGLSAGLRASEAGAGGEAADRQAARVYARCVAAMAQDRCIAAGRSAAMTLALPTPSVVFVAGTGPVPGDVYLDLVRAGDRMCEVVRTACARAPRGPVCHTASSLW
jgi:hypothetical protein